MVKSRDRFYGIDLIGYPGSFEEHIDIYQYKLFNRIGIPVFPLPYSQWNFQREIMEEELSKYIEVV
jgi:Cu2+-containing amine oxidase